MRDLQVTRTVRRDKLTAMLFAALESGEYRFARQAALAWLAAFQGDIEVALLHAQAMAADGKVRQGAAALHTIIQKDPICVDAYRQLAVASKATDPGLFQLASTGLFVLGYSLDDGAVAGWGEPMRQAMLAYEEGQYSKVRAYLQEVRQIQSDLLIADVLDLLIARSEHETDLTTSLAERFHKDWPECLYISLLLAESYLHRGKEQEAVHLLHLCAANDAMGQTARRLWGDDHPYRSLWPDDMVIVFDLPIPAGVAGYMGWNRLAPGEIRGGSDLYEENGDISSASLNLAGGDGVATDDNLASEKSLPIQQSEDIGSISWLESIAGETGLGDAEPVQATGEPAVEEETVDPVEKQSGEGVEETTGTRPPEIPVNFNHNGHRRHGRKADIDGTAQSVSGEFERLAKKLKQPMLSRVDGRFPIYVILSSRDGLTAQFGPQTTTILHNEMRKLAAAVRRKPGWNAMVYLVDDAACTGQYGLNPADARDPWKVKHALSDLDVALRQRGEMIGALLIIGGDEIVPFHRLPNPTDDLDGEVLSDSPYATLDANYFVPEWPVGRLPGEKGSDAGLLLEQLHAMQRYHSRRRKAQSMFGIDWLRWVGALMGRFIPMRSATSFGYTAAVWRRSSLAVFRPIGAPHTVKASPPENSVSVDRERVTGSSLGYYNLHGLEDSPDWYGQRDPLERGDGPDYPVALSPADLKRNGRSPRVVFSEACYGAHILEKTEKHSLALKFLNMGTMAVVGSTCTAYGSINTPLIAADLLGNLFWQHLKSGRTAGEALMQAKIDLVREMNRRQGYLDGEDQKTLISFVLYGDPLAVYDGFRVQGKAHRMKTHPYVKTISDQTDENITSSQVSGEVLTQVKGLVAEYLPGADLAGMHFARQVIPVEGKGKNGPARKKDGVDNSERIVVTVSKRVKEAEHTHLHTMRVTLDETGKAVKLSISR